MRQQPKHPEPEIDAMMFIRLLLLLVLAVAGLVIAISYEDMLRYLKMRSM